MRSNQLHFDDHGIFAAMARALAMPPSQSDTLAHVSRPAPERRRGLVERLERWLWEREQRAVEAYLAQSADIHELELRMRRLERGHPNFFR